MQKQKAVVNSVWKKESMSNFEQKGEEMLVWNIQEAVTIVICLMLGIQQQPCPLP